MIEIKNTETYGWKAAIRGMRNAMNSWDRMDSGICYKEVACHTCQENRNNCKANIENSVFVVGYNDLHLMQRLRNAGTDHRKYMRMITVSCDITAPLYWWKQLDTYKVGTVANSCSTMHKIHAKKFSVDDFSCEYILEDGDYDRPRVQLVETENNPIYLDDTQLLMYNIAILNECRELYLSTKDKRYWYKMIQLLPDSYIQKRTIMLNYEVLANIYKSRKNHKLEEWHAFCDWIKTLPYSELITREE